MTMTYFGRLRYSGEGWKVDVLDQSAQSSLLASRSSASVSDKSVWLLGQVDGPCVWAREVCLLLSYIL